MTAEYWHARAAEALARADQMRDPEAIRTMRVLAELYERTARRLDRDTKQDPSQS